MHLSPKVIWPCFVLVACLFITGCIDPCLADKSGCAAAITELDPAAQTNNDPAMPIAAATAAAFIRADFAPQELVEPLPWLTLSEENPVIAEESFTLTASAAHTITVSVAGSTVLFYLFSLDAPLTVTLVDPTGWVITPEVAAATGYERVIYGAGRGNPLTAHGFSAQYQVLNPAIGDWQVIITSAETNSGGLYATVRAPWQLRGRLEQLTYPPGEPVTVRASLEEYGQSQVGALITGTLHLPDGATQLLTFTDDGRQGDLTPQDGNFAAQFMAPATPGRPRINLQATYEAVVATAFVGVDVLGPTATLHRVSGERLVDTNGNGLANALEIDLVLDVQTAGDYDFQAALVNSTGAPLTLMEFLIVRGRPLATGLQTVTLSFKGQAIRRAGSDGPYVLSNLFISYREPTLPALFMVDMAENVHTTAAYMVNHFEGE